MIHTRRIVPLALAVLGSLAIQANAGIPLMKLNYVTVDELTGKLEAILKEHPDNVEAQYRLGRAHYLAAVLTLDKIAVQAPQEAAGKVPPGNTQAVLDTFDPGVPNREDWGSYGFAAEKPDPAADNEKDRHGQPWGGGITAKEMKPEVIEAHMRAGLKYLRKAAEADGANARYHLALGAALELAARTPDKLGDALGAAGKPTAEGLRDAAQAEYVHAYDLTIQEDLKRAALPAEGRFSLISYVAGRSYLRLVELKPAPPDQMGDKPEDPKAKKVQEMTESLVRLKRLPMPGNN